VIHFKEERLMLVLSRRLGEKIVIPGLETEISVVAIQGTKVRIRISAPADVVVRRQEIAVLPTEICNFDVSSR
jgi:carbon storage regulator CsrA